MLPRLTTFICRAGGASGASRLELEQFSDAQFDPKKWLNSQLKAAEARVLTGEIKAMGLESASADPDIHKLAVREVMDNFPLEHCL